MFKRACTVFPATFSVFSLVLPSRMAHIEPEGYLSASPTSNTSPHVLLKVPHRIYISWFGSFPEANLFLPSHVFKVEEVVFTRILRGLF